MLFTSKDIKLKPRSKQSHKGQNGRVLVIGGSEDYVGAPTFVGLAALATLRSGADLVTIAAPENVAWAINCISPDLITKKIKCKYFAPKNTNKVLELAKKANVVTVGNGMGLKPNTKKFILEIIKKVNKPILIDADALKVVKMQECKNAVLTPHAGEYETLLKNSKLKGKPEDLKSKLGTNVLVAKGHPKTIIVTKNKIALNTTGHPGMTHGGTGDVLAGTIAGLMAQGNSPFMSACTAAYINGKIGEKLARKYGVGYLASDMLKEIPKMLKRYVKIT